MCALSKPSLPFLLIKNKFSLDDLGLPLDLADMKIGEMKGQINGVINDVTGGKAEEFKSAAKEIIKEAGGGSG